MLFNTILREAGFVLDDVRLLRHKDRRATKGRTPYELWRDNRTQFDIYQSVQSVDNRSKLKARYWASFLGTPANETMFAGVYGVRGQRLLEHDTPKPHMDGVDKAGSCDVYELTTEQALEDLSGRLFAQRRRSSTLAQLPAAKVFGAVGGTT